MYGPGLKVLVGKREEIKGEPLSKLEVMMNNATKNVLFIMKIKPEIISEEFMNNAAKWLGDQCEKMSSQTCTYHGVVITDNSDYKFDLVEVDDEITKP